MALGVVGLGVGRFLGYLFWVIAVAVLFEAALAVCDGRVHLGIVELFLREHGVVYGREQRRAEG